MGKNGNKGISSELTNETNDPMGRSDDDSDNDNTGIGRTYGCSFCKRGFTNAQALGGHMNIHRKDKAKAKYQYSSSSSINSYKFEDNKAPHYSSTNITTPQWNRQDFYKSISIPKPSSQPSLSYYRNNDIPIGRSSLFEIYDHLGTDLSLRMNTSRSTRQEIQEKKGDNCEDDIDLELRLGYDP